MPLTLVLDCPGYMTADPQAVHLSFYDLVDAACKHFGKDGFKAGLNRIAEMPIEDAAQYESVAAFIFNKMNDFSDRADWTLTRIDVVAADMASIVYYPEELQMLLLRVVTFWELRLINLDLGLTNAA